MSVSAADVLSASARVITTGGDINVSPFSARSISLGGATPVAGELHLPQATFNNFSPSSGIVRIGDANGSTNTRDITVRGQINNFGSESFNTLSLVTGNGAVSQTAGSTLSLPRLAVKSSSSITLDQNNNVQFVALESDFGNVTFRQPGSLTLNIDTVAGLSGVQAGGTVNIAADKLNINHSVSAGSVVITPFTPSLGLDIVATKDGLNLELTPTELNRVFASTLTLGNNSTGNVSVTTPVDLTGASNLSFVSSSFTVGAMSPITVPGNITVTADAVTLGAPVSANPSFGTISIAPLNTATPVDLGGPDGMAGTGLGLDATDVGNLSARFINVGNSSTASIMTSTAPVHSAAPGGVTLTTAANGPITVNAGAPLDNTGNLTLNGGGAAAITLNDAVASTGGALAVTTGTMGSITVNGALSALGNTTLTADAIAIPGGGVSGANVTLNTVTNGQSVNLGTLAGGRFRPRSGDVEPHHDAGNAHRKCRNHRCDEPCHAG